MTRYVLTVDLKDDPSQMEAYRTHHRHVWPEVVESLRAVGVEGMDIRQLGRRLVMVLEVRDGVDLPRALAAHRQSSPRVAEWERLMDSFQEAAPGGAAGGWALMEPVFLMDGPGAG